MIVMQKPAGPGRDCLIGRKPIRIALADEMI
jgi:hypothetical protein